VNANREPQTVNSKPPTANSLRLHLNENTAGCSPAVFDALRALGRSAAGFYPDYDEARDAVATFLGVPSDYVQLTNGLDEGILAATAAAFKDRTGGVPDALGVVPAFDVFEGCTTALGGRMVTVPLGSDLTLNPDELRAALTPQTRIVFVTNPHNPSGTTIPLDRFRRLAQDVRPALLFVDETYTDFAGVTLIDAPIFSAHPNLVVGRSFSKAFGLAGLRTGALVASPATLEPMRQIVPVFSLNAWATAALPVALADRAYRDWYVGQAAESRTLLTAACARLGLHTWPGVANFQLVRVGGRVDEIVAALAARGVLVRDRSREHGCDGCIRITAGLVEDTQRALDALEEVLCAVR
jgi:histidinol-phosphate aminotransferase